MSNTYAIGSQKWLEVRSHRKWEQAGSPTGPEGDRRSKEFWNAAVEEATRELAKLRSETKQVTKPTQPMDPRIAEKSIYDIFGWASAAGGTCFSIKFFIPLPGVDVLPLTWITKTMCDKIASNYGYNSLKGLSMFTGVVIGAASGIKLAAELTSIIPVVGAGANATATFTLHLLTGISMVIVFELLKQGAVTEEFLAKSPVGSVSMLMGLSTDVIAEMARGGSGVDALKHAVEAFKTRGLPPNSNRGFQ